MFQEILKTYRNKMDNSDIDDLNYHGKSQEYLKFLNDTIHNPEKTLYSKQLNIEPFLKSLISTNKFYVQVPCNDESIVKKIKRRNCLSCTSTTATETILNNKNTNFFLTRMPSMNTNMITFTLYNYNLIDNADFSIKSKNKNLHSSKTKASDPKIQSIPGFSHNNLLYIDIMDKLIDYHILYPTMDADQAIININKFDGNMVHFHPTYCELSGRKDKDRDMSIESLNNFMKLYPNPKTGYPYPLNIDLPYEKKLQFITLIIQKSGASDSDDSKGNMYQAFLKTDSILPKMYADTHNETKKELNMFSTDGPPYRIDEVQHTFSIGKPLPSKDWLESFDLHLKRPATIKHCDVEACTLPSNTNPLIREALEEERIKII